MTENERTSAVSGFYKLTPAQRREIVARFAGLEEADKETLADFGVLGEETADRMIENVIGTWPLPLGVASNFLIDNKEYFVPLALEEPSVVAAASNMAKATRSRGGITTSNSDPIMIAQIQLAEVADPNAAKLKILEHRERLIELANQQDPILVKFGGGARDLEVRIIRTPTGPMVVTHLKVDCRDAMGANAVNTMAEALAPEIEELTGGRVYLRILSNLAVHRLTRARAVIPPENLGGPEVVDGIVSAFSFAVSDIFRAATHNKGIMNGIDAVVLATGNDWRAVEAGAHTFAAWRATETGSFSLTNWEKAANGDLVGTIELPMPVGLVGGATAPHPVARTCVKILGVKTAQELASIIASVGLVQNLAALRALASEGIQKGHMGLHARNVAVAAGAEGDEIDKVVALLKKGGKVRADLAEKALTQVRGEG